MIGRSLKRGAIRLLKHRPLGVPAAMACLGIGARDLSRKISRECGYVPPVVDVDVPAALVGGARFQMHGARGRDQVSRGLWWSGWGSFEKPMPDLFGGCAVKARRVFDIGAYSGFYGLAAATCNPSAEVVAFEPFPAVREILIKNVALNGLSGRMRVIPAAVSDQPGLAQFYVPPNENGWIETASSLDSSFRDTHEAVVNVDVMTIDGFRFGGGCDGPVDLIKIDAEQVEHRVLAGGRRVLVEDRPIIFLEVLPCSPFCAEIEVIREQVGYLSAALHPRGLDWRDHVEPLDTGNIHGSNQVLCPAEKKEMLDELARSLGYRVSQMELDGSAAPA